MKAPKLIYQTLDDRENPEYVENHGPFLCELDNAWLGTGFYFWDTFIDNAHWWGKVRYNSNYIICKSEIIPDDNNCFDLVGNTKHLLEFEKIITLMKKKGLLTSKTTVATVLDFLFNKLKNNHFFSVRVYGINSKSKNSGYMGSLKFENIKSQYLDYKPAIQLCIYNLEKMNFRNFQVIYPESYVSSGFFG